MSVELEAARGDPGCGERERGPSRQAQAHMCGVTTDTLPEPLAYRWKLSHGNGSIISCVPFGGLYITPLILPHSILVLA